MCRRESGLVLVELLAVLVVMGILTMVAMPVLRSFGPWPLRTAAQEMAGRMREARQTAMACGSDCHLVVYEFSGRYRVDLPDGSTWVQLPQGVSYSGTNFAIFDGRPTVYFRYTGAPNKGGHVVLRDTRGERLYVIVTPVTGRVRVSKTPP